MENTLDHSRLQSLPKDLVDPPQGRAVRIYSDGIFDLFHFGHAQALEQAKKTFDDVYLLVGVCNDETTHQYKGKTVMNEQERYLSVKHCKWVDQVIPDAPWIINQEFLDKHQIDYVAHDDLPYKSEQCDDVYQFVKNQGRFIPTKRTQGVSTSDVITRIVRDYDVFVKRNLDRGITAEELNIPFLKQKEIELKKIKQQITQKVQQSEHKLTENYVRAKKELPLTVQQSLSFCEETSQALVQRFITWFYAVKR